MAKGGNYCIASHLLSLRGLFLHTVKHKQKSSDGPAVASWRDKCGNKCQEKEIASHAFCPGLWERVGR